MEMDLPLPAVYAAQVASGRLVPVDPDAVAPRVEPVEKPADEAPAEVEAPKPAAKRKPRTKPTTPEEG